MVLYGELVGEYKVDLAESGLAQWLRLLEHPGTEVYCLELDGLVVGVTTLHVLPNTTNHTNRQFSDRYSCARSLVLIEVIVCGLSMKALHASPVASTMAVSSLKMRFDRSFDRRDCQTFSTGFNSGDFDGSRMMVRFLATIRLPVPCHPARSISPTACALRAPYLLIPSRCNCMASVLA